MKYLLTTAIFLALAACTPATSPQAAMDRANHEFAGRDAGDFFTDYGSALSKKPLVNGGTSYRWLSLEPTGGADSVSVLTYPGGNFGSIGDGANGEMMSGYCEIRVNADARDRIEKLVLVQDSIGKFSGSRCAEIFAQKPD